MGQPITEYVEVRKDGTLTDGESPQGDEMFVIHLDGGDKVDAVDMRCPCGCGADCYTPVTDATQGEPKTARHWLFSRGPSGRVTLTPSIRYAGGCKAHFNVTDGKVMLHGDSGR